MEPDMRFDEGRNEVVAVVIAVAQVDGGRLTSGFASVGQILGQQLRWVKVVRGALIDQEWGGVPLAGLHQCGCIVSGPQRASLGAVAKVASEGFDAPRRQGWIADRRERRHRTKLGWMAQTQG